MYFLFTNTSGPVLFLCFSGLLTAVPYINYSPSSSTTDVSKQAVQSVHNMGYVILVLVFVAIILCVLDLFLLIKVSKLCSALLHFPYVQSDRLAWDFLVFRYM